MNEFIINSPRLIQNWKIILIKNKVKNIINGKPCGVVQATPAVWIMDTNELIHHRSTPHAFNINGKICTLMPKMDS